jgi:hypothetical protein
VIEAAEGRGFAAAERRFALAAAARPEEVWTETGALAGRSFTLAFVGRNLAAAIGPSLRHLATSGPFADRRETSLRLWDCAATGVEKPDVPGGAEAFAEGEGWRVSSHAGGRYLCEDRPTSQFWLAQASGQCLGCFADAGSIGAAARARPLQRMASIFCRSLGLQEIHAGMVARDGAGVLLLGGGGRGKSTAALDGLHEGLDFIGDDSITIGDDGEHMRGYCLYASARVLPRQIARWPRFAGDWHVSNPPEPKMLLLPGTLTPCPVAASARIVAIALPVVAGNGLRVLPAQNKDAFHALVHDSRDHYSRFGLTPAEFARFAKLARSVPCYRLEVDDDPRRVAGALAGLIEEAAA